MTTELALSESEFAGALAAVTQNQDNQTGGAAFMKFSKGEWLYGVDEDEPTEGSVWAINVKSFKHGYIVWDDGEIVTEVMTPLGTPQANIPQEHIEEAAANKEYSANPQVQFEMLCVEGEEKGVTVLYSASSVGGRKAVAKVLKQITKQATDKKPYVALVELTNDSYKHTKYGKVYVPVFDVKEYIAEAELADLMNAQQEDTQDEVEDETPGEVEVEDEEKEAKPKARTRRRR